ncbi:uncharacterized protein A4U43_C01F36110 [Asparagus officinalis]|uniref:Tetrahydrofolate dehydrogenase/cyclohydrolase NAD(P)-binding domain-containing protein n=1 Tax=Asparagus officinalis TaxID=4686 RepID=A0A5P1FXT9_ASPOF|nr:uncharacterized protein A4U43_C01F36110 [Asparagus officinalis]
MRALLLSRLVKGELSRIPRPPPLLLMKYASLSSSAHSEDEPTKKKRKRSDCHILGPDLPDIWTPRSSAPPVPSSSSQTHVNDELIPTIIDGKSIAQDIRTVVAEEVRKMNNAIKKVPGLAVVLVGQRRDSQSYVRFKTKACEEVGIRSLLAELPEDCADDEVLNTVLGFNEDPSIHGILVQLPLPQRHHATVSTVHAFTKNPEDITREADIVISAAGVPNLVRKSWLKRGSVVIDVGTNPVEDPNSEHGYYLAGDVCYEEALQVVSAITPVPGGVGPVTVAMLLCNTLESAKRTHELS